MKYSLTWTTKSAEQVSTMTKIVQQLSEHYLNNLSEFVKPFSQPQFYDPREFPGFLLEREGVLVRGKRKDSCQKYSRLLVFSNN